MKSQLLRFALRRSTENAQKSEGLAAKMKKSYESPLPINVKGDSFRHADRYGLKTYSLKELSETGPDYLRGLVWTLLAGFLVWDVFHDVSCHNALYTDESNKQFHFFQDDMDLFGETGGAMGSEATKTTKMLHGGHLFYGGRFPQNPMFDAGKPYGGL